MTKNSPYSFPKAELHVHLEGSIEPATLIEMDPSLTLDEIRQATTYTDFAGFIQSYVWVNRKLRGPHDYGLAARRLFESLAAQNVQYAEVTLSAGMILWKQEDLDAIFAALAREATASPIRVRWILDVTRQWGPVAAAPVFEFAAAHQKDGVVAVGIGGVEAEGRALWFKDLYREARKQGLRLVAHAGETTDAQSVWDALEIGSERIGHGIRAAEDVQLMKELARRGVPLEISISSNVRTGAVTSLREHPVRRLFDAGVPIVLNTDDPALFGCTLNGEYEIAEREFGFSAKELAGLAENGFRFAFGLR